MSPPRHALILFDHDGFSAIVQSKRLYGVKELKKSSRCLVNFDGKPFSIELLELSDNEKLLEETDSVWSSSLRAKAIEEERDRRSESRSRKIYGGFLDIWPTDQSLDTVDSQCQQGSSVPPCEQDPSESPGSSNSTAKDDAEELPATSTQTTKRPNKRKRVQKEPVRRPPGFLDGLTSDEVDVIQCQVHNFLQNKRAMGSQTDHAIVISSVEDMIKLGVPAGDDKAVKKWQSGIDQRLTGMDKKLNCLNKKFDDLMNLISSVIHPMQSSKSSALSENPILSTTQVPQTSTQQRSMSSLSSQPVFSMVTSETSSPQGSTPSMTSEPAMSMVTSNTSSPQGSTPSMTSDPVVSMVTSKTLSPQGSTPSMTSDPVMSMVTLKTSSPQGSMPSMTSDPVVSVVTSKTLSPQGSTPSMTFDPVVSMVTSKTSSPQGSMPSMTSDPVVSMVTSKTSSQSQKSSILSEPVVSMVISDTSTPQSSTQSMTSQPDHSLVTSQTSFSASTLPLQSTTCTNYSLQSDTLITSSQNFLNGASVESNSHYVTALAQSHPMATSVTSVPVPSFTPSVPISLCPLNITAGIPFQSSFSQISPIHSAMASLETSGTRGIQTAQTSQDEPYAFSNVVFEEILEHTTSSPSSSQPDEINTIEEVMQELARTIEGPSNQSDDRHSNVENNTVEDNGQNDRISNLFSSHNNMSLTGDSISIACPPGASTLDIASHHDCKSGNYEFRIRPDVLTHHATANQSSEGNFLWSLAKELFHPSDLVGRNFSGRKGRKGLSPRRKHALLHAYVDCFGRNKARFTRATNAINSGIRYITMKDKCNL